MSFESTIKEFDVKHSVVLKDELIPVVINISSAMGTISRVVSISNKVCVESVVSNIGSAQIEGKVHSVILIRNIDGTFDTLNSSTNFTLPIINQSIVVDSEILCSAKMGTLSGVQASENMVNFTANVVIKPILIVTKKLKLLESLGANIEQKRDNIEIKDIIAATSQDFEINVELDLPNSISKVLSIDSHAIVKKAETGNDMIVLHGELFCNMLYLTADEEPKLKNHRYIQEFTHELLANGVVLTDFVSATICDQESTFELAGEITSAKGTVVLNNKLKANLVISQLKTMESVVDAFCPIYNLNSNYVDIEEQQISTAYFVEKIDGNISFGEDAERIDRVLSVNDGNVIISDVVLTAGVVSIKGVLNSDVVYQLDTEEARIESVLAEIPFEVKLKDDRVDENTICTLDIKTRDIDARNKRAKEIDVLAEISISINIINNNKKTVLQDINLGEKRTQNIMPFGYYIIPEAQSLWDASKLLLVSGDLIMAQNPDLQFPITSPQKVIIYRQKVVE